MKDFLILHASAVVEVGVTALVLLVAVGFWQYLIAVGELMREREPR